MEKCKLHLLLTVAVLTVMLAMTAVYMHTSNGTHSLLVMSCDLAPVSSRHEQPKTRKIMQCPFGLHHLQRLPDPLPRVSTAMRRVYVQAPWGAPIIWSFTVDANATARVYSGPYNVGLVITAIGKYIVFLQRLISSGDQFFMNSQNVTYFVFTDHPAEVAKIKSKRTIVVLQEKDGGWPKNSMLRSKMIHSHRNQFHMMDFLYCIDVDVMFYDEVDVEVLEYRVGTLHPMHYAEEKTTFPFDANHLSRAFVNMSESEYYYSGAFFGGCRDEMIHLAGVMHTNIMQDLKRLNYIARWHDESHLNRYFTDNLPTKLLSPEYYCFTSFCNPMPTVRITSPEDIVKQKLKHEVMSANS